MNPRRYPRTLQEAFGPYTDSRLEPLREPRSYKWADWALYIIALITPLIIWRFS